MVDSEVCEIDSIEFGVFSAEEIRKNSVFEVVSSKISNNDLYGTVYDPRSGPIKNGNCITCKLGIWECAGHFGHLELATPIIHPLFISHVVNILKIFCGNCFNFILSEDHLNLNNINLLKKSDKFSVIFEKIKKCNKCFHCNFEKKEYKISTNEMSFPTIFEEKIEIDVNTIKTIFEHIDVKYIKMLNIAPPINYILTVFPIIPVCCRPYIISDGNICDDDLTYQLVEIVKNNSKCIDAIKNNLPDDLKKFSNNLKFRIQTYFNNSQNKAKHATTGRSIKGIKERMTGKDGQIRNNLLGKRCEQSGRTVIGPDPTLKLDQVIVPKQMCEILTIPEHVTPFNLDLMNKIVNTGKANYIVKNKKKLNVATARIFNGTILKHGDIIIRNGKEIEILNTFFKLEKSDLIQRNGENIKLELPGFREIKVEVGDVVHRHLIDGDIAFLNRQPTLHKGSMMGFKIKISNQVKTFKINLAAAKSFNADFDGDEMNIHIPQSIEARAEIGLLSLTKNCILSTQAGKPNLTIVQDSLTAAFLMSNEDITKDYISKHQFFDLICCLKNSINVFEKMNRFKQILISIGMIESEQCKWNGFNGKCLLSFLFPDDFFVNFSDLKIHQGVLIEGRLSKKYLSSSENSLIKLLFKEYGTEICADFIDNIQFLTNNWLLIYSFSINAGDCLKQKNIDDTINRCLVEAEKYKSSTKNKIIRERKIINELSKAKDIGMKIAKDALKKNNNFITTVEAGSKGDYFNIAQITGLLGQQNVTGGRIDPTLNNNTRSLPHYNHGSLSLEEEYESRGFIRSSFVKGLNPKEFFFHCMSGRKGVCDTAMSTATSGYNMRRIVKLTEDIRIQYDGTVSDTLGRKYQTAYGDLGYDPSMMVKVDGKSEVCNIERLANRLNFNYENKN